MKISVVIRTKNQEHELEFLLRNLKTRYEDDIDEIIVLDNLSSDNSEKITLQYGAKFISIKDFSYGGSANIAAQSAGHDIVVLFSAHSYPVSHDFFKLIKTAFLENKNLAGVRCLHNPNDYQNFINGISAKEDSNKSGLVFAGSAFSKEVWLKHPFNEDVPTFEDKEWTLRILKEGYDIELIPAIFCYDKKRTKAQAYFRFKNDLKGNYQIWGILPTWKGVFWGLLKGVFNLFFHFSLDAYYLFKRFFRRVIFLINKPTKL